MKRVLKVESVHKIVDSHELNAQGQPVSRMKSVIGKWNEDDPDCAVCVGDKLLSVNGIPVGDLDLDNLILPAMPPQL